VTLKEPVPATSADLTDLAQEQYNLEESAALTLGFSLANLAPNVSHDVLVYQVARYKDIAATDGNTYRFGIAVEATIVVTVDKFQGGLTLPAIAANVQLGHSTASSDLSVRGYAFQAATAITLPPWGSFDVDSYTDFEKAIDDIVAKVLFDANNIKPVLLATSAPPLNAPDTKPPLHRFFYRLKHFVEGDTDWGTERLKPPADEPATQTVPAAALAQDGQH
jgi:hypothetical protein